ncbi:MAG: POTRA domain-containing protein, partial [Stagnimonas sp.]|nr:POTRA domain-containing protein [Stagnimonas sp.]
MLSLNEEKSMGVVPHRWVKVFATLALLGTAAQAADPLTPGDTSGTLKPPAALQPPPPVASPVPPPRPKAPAEAGAKTVTVQRFEFAGNRLFSDAQLAPLVASFLGRPISLSELYEAADRITSHYIEAGYTLASAVLPAQKISGGTVQIEIIEGRVDQIVYEGLERYRAEDLNVYVGDSAGRIYRANRFEDGLRSIDALPGLDAKAVLRPGREYGSTDIVVQAKEDPFEGLFFVDNSGRDTVGETRFATQLSFNNPLQVGDQFSLLALRSSDNLLEYLSGAYSLPTGWRGSRLNLSYGYAQFELAGPFTGVEGSNRSLRGELELPLLRGGPEQLTLIGAVSNTKADTDFTGIPLRGTDLSLLEVGGTYTRSHGSGGVSQLVGTIGSNFKKADGNDPNSQAFRLELDAQHL